MNERQQRSVAFFASAAVDSTGRFLETQRRHPKFDADLVTDAFTISNIANHIFLGHRKFLKRRAQ
jgi:hypothetical protein